MGGGVWTTSSFTDYVSTAYDSKGIKYNIDVTTNSVNTSATNQEIFTARSVDHALNPRNVIRECLDSEEHPKTVPVLLCLDLTGSMGQCAVEIAKKLNPIMTSLYEKVQDVEFCIMGVGDLAYDDGPIQISQFESDIRIAEQLDKLWFEFGGGGNNYESYTAAWYMGSRHCKLDCWNRGEKGIIITIGDECLNPYLPVGPLNRVTGDHAQTDIGTKTLYKEICEKYNVYHIQVNHNNYAMDLANIRKSFEMLGENYKEATLDNITETIIDIILDATANNSKSFTVQEQDGISW